MKSIDLLYAINEAIWLRDNADRISTEVMTVRVKNIGEFGVYSSRQISNICGNKIGHVTVSKIIGKKSKSGGRLNPASLDSIREILFAKEAGRLDKTLFKSVLNSGTSQGMLSRLTGVSQSKISRSLNE